MFRFVRAGLAAVAATAAILLITYSTAALQGVGQTSGQSPTAREGGPFRGDGVVTAAMQAMEATFVVSVKADGGKVTATVGSDLQPAVRVPAISMSGESLVLRYTVDYQGMPISTVMTLTPQGTALRVAMAMMDGQYEMLGSASRQVPGAPQRSGGFGGRGAPSKHTTDLPPQRPDLARSPAQAA